MPTNLTEYYDCVINWEKRLAREMPLLEELARSAGRRVLVPACGTGGHVVALAQRGFHPVEPGGAALRRFRRARSPTPSPTPTLIVK